MRPFWAILDIEGRSAKPCGGPRKKDGRMEATIFMKDNGASVVAVEVKCYVKDGKQCVDVLDENGKVVYSRHEM